MQCSAFITGLAALALLACRCEATGRGMRGPPMVMRGVGADYGCPPDTGYGQDCCRVWLSAYQRIFSRFIRSRCPMEPSCSCYALAAVVQHGPAAGVVLTADRLLHEGSEIRTVPQVWIENRGWRCPDPVENNTAWWCVTGTPYSRLPVMSRADAH